MSFGTTRFAGMELLFVWMTLVVCDVGSAFVAFRGGSLMVEEEDDDGGSADVVIVAEGGGLVVVALVVVALGVVVAEAFATTAVSLTLVEDVTSSSSSCLENEKKKHQSFLERCFCHPMDDGSDGRALYQDLPDFVDVLATAVADKALVDSIMDVSIVVVVLSPSWMMSAMINIQDQIYIFAHNGFAISFLQWLEGCYTHKSTHTHTCDCRPLSTVIGNESENENDLTCQRSLLMVCLLLAAGVCLPGGNCTAR